MEGKGAVQPSTPSSLLADASKHHAIPEHSSWSPRRSFQDEVIPPPIHFSGITSPRCRKVEATSHPHLPLACGRLLGIKSSLEISCLLQLWGSLGSDHPAGHRETLVGAIHSLVAHREQRDGGDSRGDSRQVTEGDEEADMRRLEPCTG